MKSKYSIYLAAILIVSLFISIIPGCDDTQEAQASSYMAVVPKVLHAGGQEAISLTLFENGKFASGNVEVALLQNSDVIAKSTKKIDGKGNIQLTIPDIEEGDYQIRVKAAGFEDTAKIKVERSFLIFVETDKPIYKPGQTIHIRAITLNSDLRPESQQLTVDVLDAKGIKIFRDEITTDDYGMATLELPISDQPNLGVWKINAVSEKGETQLDVRVEEYVLPKYEVTVDLPKEWFLVNEKISGTVTSEYSFGKPVKGELEIVATKYVGQWEEFATFSKEIDGEADFEIPAAGYVAGVPAAGGQGNVMLEITVTEPATGYKETTSKMLTIASSSMNIQIIPESPVFKPSLPFNFLLITESPDNQPLDANLDVTITYLNDKFSEESKYHEEINSDNGKTIVQVTPPEDAVALIIECFELTERSSVEPARAVKTLESGYSPSGNFIHVEQISEGIPDIGEGIIFKVHSTDEARNFYYEVVSRDKVVFSDFTKSDEIRFETTPQMSPSSKLLVYQILPNSEVAADYIPFEVTAAYPHEVNVEFNEEEAKPGEAVKINVQTEGASKVGLVAVDKSVFILAENRLNLQQVMDALEQLYMEPQVELHEWSIYGEIDIRGAKDIFEDAGVVVLSNNKIPEGKQLQNEQNAWMWREGGEIMFEEADGAFPMATGAVKNMDQAQSSANGLAEVQRIRQFFPETWLWEEITTNADGKGSLDVEVPDTITTWMLRAIAISKEKGLGIDESQLVAFQPFFLTADLPYSAIRNEEFPIRVSIYNYLDEAQTVVVTIEEDDWFTLLDDTQKTVEIAANDIGGATFKIKPKQLGINRVQLKAQSSEAADAIIKTLIVEPEGVSREVVENLVISDGFSKKISTAIPPFTVEGSGRAYVAVTSSYLTQTIDGLEGLIQMPFGCGEQNMIVFAPDVYITKYLEESGQLKPEIMAKAEKLMITGYQRELTYRHRDGSFSAFGESDESGSLFLTAFVLKCFAQAEGLIYIDDSILSEAEDWIISHQNNDGSFDQVGFVCHEEMLGGVKGKTALTAYVAISLLEAGEKTASAKAINYLENELDDIDDAYTMAIVTYALELAGSAKADEAQDMLMDLATEDENGLHWGNIEEVGIQKQEQEFRMMPEFSMPNKSVAIEATGYATMALVKHGDAFNASRAAKWLVSQRNAYGGYGSTQDTVIGLQALIEYASDSRADVDLTVDIVGDGINKQLRITQENFDVLQIVEVPVDEDITISVEGNGDAIGQVVTRYNIPDVENDVQQTFDVKVDYDTTEVEVNDTVEVSVEVEFNPVLPIKAEMVVLDVSVPTGFAPVTETIEDVVNTMDNIKRYDIAGRKVIFYIDEMEPGDTVSFSFDVQALYPVKAKGVASQVYNYYNPDMSGETLGEDITIIES